MKLEMARSLLAVGMWLCLEQRASAADSTALEHHGRGVELYRQGQYAQALAAFERAYELDARPGLLFNLGQAHYQLGHYATALRMLSEYLAHAQQLPEERSADVREQLEDLRKKAARVALSVDVRGATVTVDGRQLGSSPLAEPLLLDPGHRRIELSCKGYTTRITVVQVASGQLSELQVRLEPLPKEPLRHEPASGLEQGLWLVTAGLGALAIGGVVMTLIERERYEDARRSPQGDDPVRARQRLQDQQSRVRSWGLATDIVAGTGLVVAGTALYVHWQPLAESDERGAAGKLPSSLGLSGLTLTAAGRF